MLEIIKQKRRKAPQMARALLVIIRRFFNWCIDQHSFGLTVSPCDRLKVEKIIGATQSRDRRLNDAELFALWRVTGRMRHPVGSLYRMLLLTGLRLNEVAHLSWPEIHGDSIVIPAARMKAKNGAAREHLVPLSSAAQEVIAAVPKYRGAPFLFTFNAGKRPLAMTSAIKSDLDRRMLRTLKAMARKRGDDHDAVTLPNWVTHDLRRVVRSGLSQLRIPANVAEAVLAHKPEGIVGTYDVHQYEDEKREALEAWARKLATIVNPTTPAKVIKLRGRR